MPTDGAFIFSLVISESVSTRLTAFKFLFPATHPKGLSGRVIYFATSATVAHYGAGIFFDGTGAGIG